MPVQTQKELKKLDKQLKSAHKTKEDRRQEEDFRKFLTPHGIRKQIASGKPFKLKYGDSGSDKVVKYKDLFDPKGRFKIPETGLGWILFELDDLKKFERALSKTKNARGTSQGVTAAQMLGSSDSKRIKYANIQIQNAILYKIHGNLISFMTSAGPKSDKAHHYVQIRLEEWDEIAKDPKIRDYTQAAKKATLGRLSIDCDCEDHQYRYRYLVGMWNASLKPIEHDFPKIRNPKLKGFTCKHVIKSLLALRMPFIHSRLGKEMARQAAKGGTSETEKFLTAKEVQGFEKQPIGKLLIKDAKALHREMSRAKRDFAKKRRDMAEKDREIKELKAKNRAYRAEAKFDRDKTATNLSAFLDGMKASGMSKDEAIKMFSVAHGMPVENVKSIAKEYNVK